MYKITFSSSYPCLCGGSRRFDDRIRELYTKDGQPRLLDQVREQILSRHYSIRTERFYCKWFTPHDRDR